MMVREKMEKNGRMGERFISSHPLFSLFHTLPTDDAHERTIASLSETLKSSARV